MGNLKTNRNSRSTRAAPRFKQPLSKSRSWAGRIRTWIVFLSIALLSAAGLLKEFGMGMLSEPVKGSFRAIDGDSLRLGNREFRLKGIDAPELYQTCGKIGGHSYACGRDAHATLLRLTRSRPLSCSNEGEDRYGRTLAFCKAGSLDINGEMVRSGWAIAYGSVGIVYWGAENDARSSRRGLWSGTFETPADWRAAHRGRPINGTMSVEFLPD